jgi:hypothetical protein
LDLFSNNKDLDDDVEDKDRVPEDEIIVGELKSKLERN